MSIQQQPSSRGQHAQVRGPADASAAVRVTDAPPAATAHPGCAVSEATSRAGSTAQTITAQTITAQAITAPAAAAAEYRTVELRALRDRVVARGGVIRATEVDVLLAAGPCAAVAGVLEVVDVDLVECDDPLLSAGSIEALHADPGKTAALRSARDHAADAARLDLIVCWERQKGWVEANILTTTTRFQAASRAHSPTAPFAVINAGVTEELAAVSGSSPGYVQDRLEVAALLNPSGPLAATHAALAHGWINEAIARKIAHDCAELTTEQITSFQAQVLPRLIRDIDPLTGQGVRCGYKTAQDRINRVLHRIDPDRARRIRTQAHTHRGLSFRALPDEGLGVITATLPLHDAAELYDIICHLADQAVAHDRAAFDQAQRAARASNGSLNNGAVNNGESRNPLDCNGSTTVSSNESDSAVDNNGQASNGGVSNETPSNVADASHEVADTADNSSHDDDFESKIIEGDASPVSGSGSQSECDGECDGEHDGQCGTDCSHRPDDVRTLGQARVDLLAGAIRRMAELLEAGEALPAPQQRTIGLVMDMATLTALRDTQALLDGTCELPGLGPVDPELARIMATDAGWQRFIHEPTSAELLDRGKDTYQPSKDMRAFIRARDPYCTFPGCRRRSVRCQLDHITPWPEGQTTRDNLHPLCQHHHNLKTHGRWQVKRDPDTGGTTWITPHGKVIQPERALLPEVTSVTSAAISATAFTRPTDDKVPF